MAYNAVMTVRRGYWLVTLAILVGCQRIDPAPTLPQPGAGLNPERVVSLVVEAMKHNDTPEPDAGIKTAFRFASPANRAQTGPIDKFIRMVKSPRYRPFIEHVQAMYQPMTIEGDVARQQVTLIIEPHRITYLFVLSKQHGGEYDGCRMTDAVTFVKMGVEPDVNPDVTIL